MTPLVLLGVGVLGGVGALARFKLDARIARRLVRPFPFGTLVVNFTGALALGFLVGVVLTGDAYRLIGTGLIGAYTTFSTWMLETERLGEEDERLIAVANIIVTLVLGAFAAWLGRWIGRLL